MNKLSLSLLALLVGAIAFGAIAWQKQNALAAQNQDLNARLASLEQKLAQASDRSASINSDLEREAQASKLELMRLRNEVSQLRNGAQSTATLESELNRLREENRQIRTAQSTPQPAPPANSSPAHLAPEQWHYAGLANPNDALTSALWELKHGQLPSNSSLLADPDRVSEWQQQLLGATGVRIIEQQQTQPNAVRLKVLLEGSDQVKELRLQQGATGWQVANFGKEFDPMQFYRQNPDLMRRYFPHLAPKENAVPAE